MQNRFFAIALAFSGLLILLHLIGYFFPSGLNWGYQSLGFLPAFVTVAYLFAAAAGCYAVAKGRPERWVNPASAFLSRRPVQFLSIVLIVFVVAATALRVRAPLLGDSFYLVRNYSESLRGVAPLYPRNEPLATYYFSLLLNARHISTFSQFMATFFVADLLLGIGFIAASFFTVRNVFTEPRSQLLSMLLVLALPYMQLFFGYVETYSVVLFALSLYVLSAVLNLKGKLAFPFVMLSFLLLTLVHYLTLLTLPSLVFLAWREFKNRGWRPILTGLGSAAIIVMALLVLVDFDVSQFSASVPHHHYLSISVPEDPADAESQAYTLLSPFHAVDLANQGILMSPGVLLLLGFALLRAGRSIMRSPVCLFLVLAIVPVFLFLLVVKFDFGAAKDWDVFAPYFFLTALLGGVAFLSRQEPGDTTVASVVIVISFLNSLTYYTLNSTTAACIRRYVTLEDTRTVSPMSRYAFGLHLAQYYHQVRNPDRAVETWRRYIESDPMDRRGYRNLITNLEKIEPLHRGEIREAYGRWLAVDTGNGALRTEFVHFCIDAGNYFFNNGALDSAGSYYSEAITLQPGNANAYNNLGSVYAQEGKRDRAVEFYRKALALRPEYPEAAFNLGTIYAEKGDSAQSKVWLALASRLMKSENEPRSGDTAAAQTGKPADHP